MARVAEKRFCSLKTWPMEQEEADHRAEVTAEIEAGHVGLVEHKVWTTPPRDSEMLWGEIRPLDVVRSCQMLIVQAGPAGHVKELANRPLGVARQNVAEPLGFARIVLFAS
jgi:hypothetical protein